ncbi:MAG: Rpn family recombination-promoting nuclease/putative transposase [Fibromonadaceae bacterium]|nr:Rpn family recombination-promoting nuclease/putative transposase [Fibromonadaceae bacterium]
MTEAKTNRKYKDSVFTLLFGEKNNLIELYNAIRNTNYGSDTDIRITTLEDVLFMERINDISFVIEGKLVVLIEHQSTVNPNMPLKMLIYMGRNYEKIIDKDGLYSTKKMFIPKPEFIVLYNGVDECPDRQVMKLSEMFSEPLEQGIESLELIVTVYNINKGRNEEMATRSENLRGYEFFIYLIREYLKAGMDRDSAISRAVGDCIRQNVLKDFLEKHGSEVHNMVFGEWNWDDAKRVWQREAREDGIEEGMQNVFSLLEQGISIAEAKAKLGLNPKCVAERFGGS